MSVLYHLPSTSTTLPVLLSLLLCWGKEIGIAFVVSAQTSSTSSRAAVCSLDRFETEWITCRQIVGQTDKTCKLMTAVTATSVVNNDDEVFLSSREEEEAISSSSSSNNTTSTREDTTGTTGAAVATDDAEVEQVVVVWPSEPFRICDCTYVPPNIDYYCPMPSTDYCRVTRPHPYQISPSIPLCFRRPSRLQEFAMSVWPVLLVTCLAIFICSVCSRTGQRSICLIVASLPCWRTVYANYLLRYRPRQATVMIRRWIRRRGHRFTERYNEMMNGESGDDGENGSGTRNDSQRQRRRTNNNALTVVEETLLRDAIMHNRNGRPRMLRLATRIFRERDRHRNSAMMMMQQQQQPQLDHTESSDESQSNESAVDVQDTRGDNDQDQENDADLDGCMICFGPLCDGDRVGSLPCKHIFHVQCLKTW
jgi:Ring finger domain